MSANNENVIQPSPMVAIIPLMIGFVSFCFYVMAVHDLSNHYCLIYALGALRARIIGKYALLGVFAGSIIWYFLFLKKVFAHGWKRTGLLCLMIFGGVATGVCIAVVRQWLPVSCRVCREGASSGTHSLSVQNLPKEKFSYEDRVLIMYQWKLLHQSVMPATVFTAVLSMLDSEDARRCAYKLLENYMLAEDRKDVFVRLGERDQMLLCMLCENVRVRLDSGLFAGIGRLDTSNELFLLLARDLTAKAEKVIDNRGKFMKRLRAEGLL